MRAMHTYVSYIYIPEEIYLTLMTISEYYYGSYFLLYIYFIFETYFHYF